MEKLAFILCGLTHVLVDELLQLYYSKVANVLTMLIFLSVTRWLQFQRWSGGGQWRPWTRPGAGWKTG